ncbi:hypothetical protein NUW54_g10801 [Trametes sanguinea]|uniref:Uncharacterized protein n=1 Tax=Trametes sanguinea TaxID=158606 RepID=A0ACC1NRR9_9APHY|nr:hypothetical protein NUW54_g10801 [Trametes sanguinea]
MAASHLHGSHHPCPRPLNVNVNLHAPSPQQQSGFSFMNPTHPQVHTPTHDVAMSHSFVGGHFGSLPPREQPADVQMRESMPPPPPQTGQGSNTPSPEAAPMQDPTETDSVAIAEDKRRRNTAASARFLFVAMVLYRIIGVSEHFIARVRARRSFVRRVARITYGPTLSDVGRSSNGLSPPGRLGPAAAGAGMSRNAAAAAGVGSLRARVCENDRACARGRRVGCCLARRSVGVRHVAFWYVRGRSLAVRRRATTIRVPFRTLAAQSYSSTGVAVCRLPNKTIMAGRILIRRLGIAGSTAPSAETSSQES